MAASGTRHPSAERFGRRVGDYNHPADSGGADVTHTVVRVLLAGFWLAIAVGLLFRGLLPGEWLAGKDPFVLNLMGLTAVLLAVYNVLRLVAYLRRKWARAKLPPNPLAVPRPDTPPREREYIPELDFGRQEPPEPGAAAK
jgi:hypothetical protein